MNQIKNIISLQTMLSATSDVYGYSITYLIEKIERYFIDIDKINIAVDKILDKKISEIDSYRIVDANITISEFLNNYYNKWNNVTRTERNDKVLITYLILIGLPNDEDMIRLLKNICNISDIRDDESYIWGLHPWIVTEAEKIYKDMEPDIEKMKKRKAMKIL